MRRIPQGEFTLYESSLGWVGAATSGKGLAAVILPQQDRLRVRERLEETFDLLKERRNELLDDFINMLEEYFGGSRTVFDYLDTDMSWATPFSLEVYNRVRNIPYGEVFTYKEVASAVGQSRGYRAVGGALKRNRLPLIVPCHRVVGSSGLGGFTGAGLDVKLSLLEMERRQKIISTSE